MHKYNYSQICSCPNDGAAQVPLKKKDFKLKGYFAILPLHVPLLLLYASSQPGPYIVKLYRTRKLVICQIFQVMFPTVCPVKKQKQIK